MKVLIALVLLAISADAFPQSSEADAPIVRQLFDIHPDGTYNYAFETGNQIFAEEQGYPREPELHVKEGQFQYTAPDGQVIRLLYTADENGFQPQGSHLPTPPPIPPIIQRSLDFQKAEEQS